MKGQPGSRFASAWKAAGAGPPAWRRQARAGAFAKVAKFSLVNLARSLTS
jgi:hypothetical protein